MKGKKSNLILSTGLILVLLASFVLAACAPEAAPAAPTAPAKPAPATPATPATPTAPATPATPAPAPQAEVFQWKFAGGWPPGGAMYDQGCMNFVDNVEKYSDGRIEVDSYGGGVLYPEKETLDATGGGVVQLSMVDASYHRGKIPCAGIDSGLPMVYIEAIDALYVHNILGVAEINRREYEPFGVYYLGLMCLDGGNALMSANPINTVDDFKGVKVRTFGAYLDWCDAMGMESTYLPHDEVYMALQLGTIEAYLTNRRAQWDWRGHEVCNYYYYPALGTGGVPALVNLDAYNSLPSDLQLSLEAAQQASAAWWLYYYSQVNTLQAPYWFDDYGLTRIVWDSEVQAAMIDKAQVIWDETAAENAASAEIIGIIREYHAKKLAGEL